MSTPSTKVRAASGEDEAHDFASNRNTPALPKGLQQQNTITTLKVEEKPDVPSS